MDIKQATLSGVSWNLVARLGQQLAQFIISIILAHLLMPNDFGIVAMAMVLVNFARLFSEQGFSSALIQSQNLRPAHLHSIFWLNVALGAVLTALFFGAAPLAAKLYNLPKLSLLVRVLAFDFIISAFAIVPRALLQKQLAFKKMAILEIAATTASGAVAIILACRGFGIWSLIFNSLGLSLFTVGLVWRLTNWRPRLICEIQALRELLSFSLNVIGFNTINFWARNVDNLLIGRLLGPAHLGIYARAYGLMLLPISQISSVLGRVMFPVLSTIQEEPQRIKKIYLEAMGTISLVASPLMLGLLVTARPFVMTIYGVRWIEMVPLLQILSVVGLLQALMNPTGWIYMSCGRTDRMFKMGLLSCTGLILAIALGVWIGTTKAVAISYAVANVALFYPVIMIPGKLIKMKFQELLKEVAGPILSSAIMAAALLSLKPVLIPDSPDWVVLLAQVLFGAALYGALLQLFHVRAYHKARGLLAERWLKYWERRNAVINFS